MKRKEDPDSLWEDPGKLTRKKGKTNENRSAVPQNLETGESEVGKDLVEKIRSRDIRLGRHHVI